MAAKLSVLGPKMCYPSILGHHMDGFPCGIFTDKMDFIRVLKLDRVAPFMTDPSSTCIFGLLSSLTPVIPVEVGF